MPFTVRRRNPFQLFMFGLSLAAVGPLLLGYPGSSALDRALPNWVVVAWGMCLLVGTLAALAGMFWPWRWGGRWYGWAFERGGCILIGAGVASYAVVVASEAHPFSDVRWTVFVQGAYAAACWVRAWQIGQQMQTDRTARAVANGR